MNDQIFIQIAAYRDPELLPTLRDCLSQAADPQRLRFGICWQRSPEEHLGEFETDPRFRIIDIPYERGRGACWARQRTQSLYQGERYTLQLDSHHRFIKNWDHISIEMLENLIDQGVPKPLLTSYLPVYEPDNDPSGRMQTPLRLCFKGFTPDGPFAWMPESMDNFTSLNTPEPARFFSAHFVFTLGCFCQQVAYDPNLYFFGEEHSMAIRAFTHGFDLYHPHRVLAWHHYGRNKQPKHWADHRSWVFRNERSMRRFRRLIELGINTPSDNAELDHFGLGTQRSLKDYENYSGINFSLQGATEHARNGLCPPEPQIPKDDEEWARLTQHTWEVPIDLTVTKLPTDIDNYDFWYLGAHSAHGVELIRVDLTEQKLTSAIKKGQYTLKFQATDKPESWTVWPHSKTHGWLEKVTQPCGV